MASNYPTSLDSFTDPLANSPMNNPSHAGQHQDLNNSVEQLEKKLGTGTSNASSASANQVLVANGSGGSSWAAVPEYSLQTGLVYITQTSATSGSSLSVNNCFSSTYSNYRILVDGYQCSNAGTSPLLRMRVSNTDATAAEYYYGLVGLYVDGTSANTRGDATTFLDIGIFNSATTIPIGNSAIDVFGPNRAERTYFAINGTLYNSQFGGRTGFGEHNATTAYTGFTIYPSTGTFTNIRVWVYGYRNS